MKWNDFYEKYSSWENTDPQFKLLDTLEDIGSTFEILEVLDEIPEVGQRKILRLMIKFQAKIELSDVIGILECCDVEEDMQSALLKIVKNQGTTFDGHELVALSDFVSSDDLIEVTRIAIARGCHFTDEDVLALSEFGDKTLTELVLDCEMPRSPAYSYDDIIEMNCYIDEAYIDRLVNCSLEKGLKPTSEQIMELDESMSEKTKRRRFNHLTVS